MRTVGFLATGVALAFVIAVAGHVYGDVWAYMFGGDGRWDSGYFDGIVGTLATQILLRKWRLGAAHAEAQ